MKISEAMVKCLEAENVKVVFGYPGAAICPFYDALYESSIRHILVRQEANGGHAANGYARITGKPGVCIATSGPGATNLITAIATAYADSIPLVIITGQVNNDQIGSDAFQEADITGSAEPFVKHSYLVKDKDELPRIFKEAFYIAGTGRPGPVLIDVPMDVQNEEIDFSYPETVDIRSYKPTVKGNMLQVKRVLKALSEAQKPLICIGGGIFASDAVDEITELSRIMQIPVVTTMMGISAFSTDNELFYGMIGMHGKKIANKAVQLCDVIFLVGARVGDRAIRKPEAVEKTTKVIHIDIDPAEIGKNLGVDIPLVGDAKLVLKDMLKLAEPADRTDWLNELNSCKTDEITREVKPGTVNPRKFISDLSDRMPKNTTVVADVGQNQIWSATSYKIRDGRFLTSGGMGTMGYSVPAAIGAKLADENHPVVAICGDGAFQMEFMELATAVQHGVDIKIVVMKNNYLGMVREVQTNVYKNHLTAVSLDGSPDFITLAKAYGIPAMRVDSEETAVKAVDELAEHKGCYLVECVVDDFESTL